MCADPKSIKILSSHQYLFAVLGSVHVKAAKTLRKNVDEIKPRWSLFRALMSNNISSLPTIVANK